MKLMCAKRRNQRKKDKYGRDWQPTKEGSGQLPLTKTGGGETAPVSRVVGDLRRVDSVKVGKSKTDQTRGTVNSQRKYIIIKSFFLGAPGDLGLKGVV